MELVYMYDSESYSGRIEGWTPLVLRGEVLPQKCRRDGMVDMHVSGTCVARRRGSSPLDGKL